MDAKRAVRISVALKTFVLEQLEHLEGETLQPQTRGGLRIVEWHIFLLSYPPVVAESNLEFINYESDENVCSGFTLCQCMSRGLKAPNWAVLLSLRLMVHFDALFTSFHSFAGSTASDRSIERRHLIGS